MNVLSSIHEALQIVYAFVPQEVLLIILAGITVYPILEYQDRKANGNEETKTDKKIS